MPTNIVNSGNGKTSLLNILVQQHSPVHTMHLERTKCTLFTELCCCAKTLSKLLLSMLGRSFRICILYAMQSRLFRLRAKCTRKRHCSVCMSAAAKTSSVYSIWPPDITDSAVVSSATRFPSIPGQVEVLSPTFVSSWQV